MSKFSKTPITFFLLFTLLLFFTNCTKQDLNSEKHSLDSENANATSKRQSMYSEGG